MVTKKQELIGEIVVVDTPAKWVYIGTLDLDDEDEVVLKDVDAFDVSETTLTKQEYLLKVKQDGIAPNRRMTRIAKSQVLGMTLLEDIIK